MPKTLAWWRDHTKNTGVMAWSHQKYWCDGVITTKTLAWWRDPAKNIGVMAWSCQKHWRDGVIPPKTLAWWRDHAKILVWWRDPAKNNGVMAWPSCQYWRVRAKNYFIKIDLNQNDLDRYPLCCCQWFDGNVNSCNIWALQKNDLVPFWSLLKAQLQIVGNNLIQIDLDLFW